MNDQKPISLIVKFCYDDGRTNEQTNKCPLQFCICNDKLSEKLEMCAFVRAYINCTLMRTLMLVLLCV